jgi:AAA+ ATPase superfamily predicted ATPase
MGKKMGLSQFFIEKSNKKGKRPVIIIDELQALDEIYFNGGRELLNEIFNFFVAMTKESHLCHVIIGSSDGYFIERIYQDSKLKKTSRLLEIKYIGYEDVMHWLSNLDAYSKIDRFVL